MTSLLPPEHELILATAGGVQNASAVRSALQRDLDWERVSVIARRERAWPVIWRQLDLLGGVEIPDELELPLKRLAMVYDFRLAYLEGRLRDTLELFNEHGIRVMLLKGSALGVSVYPSFRDRPMGDLDLLVDSEEAEAAWTLCQSAGWSWPAEKYPLQQYEEHHHLPPLIDRAEPAACLEIHTAPFGAGHPFELPLDTLWQDASTLSGENSFALVPPRLDLLLHTCIHFAWSHKLGLGAWRTFRDVWALTKSGGIDWDRFVEAAQRARAASCAHWTLRLASALTNAPVPSYVISALRPPGSDVLLDRVEQHFALSLFPPERVCPSVISRTLWEVAIRPSSCGHGSVRPWHRAAKNTRTARDAFRRVRLWRLWLRYLRGLLLPVAIR